MLLVISVLLAFLVGDFSVIIAIMISVLMVISLLLVLLVISVLWVISVLLVFLMLLYSVSSVADAFSISSVASDLVLPEISVLFNKVAVQW